MAVEDGDEPRRRGQRIEQPPHAGAVGPPRPDRLHPTPLQPVRGGDHQHPGPRQVLGDLPVGRRRLDDHRPETTIASSAPGAGGISQYPPSTMPARSAGASSRRGCARGRVDSRR